MDNKSAQYWLPVILLDLRKPENMDKGREFFSEYAKKYVLPISVQYATLKHRNMLKERFFVTLGPIRHIFERTVTSMLFSFHVSEWEKVSS